VEQRLRITHALRALAREGSRVRVACAGGAYAGWLTRVGTDHIDLRTDGPGPAPGAAGEVVTVALAALEAVSTA
jgi:hypothetical protein